MWFGGLRLGVKTGKMICCLMAFMLFGVLWLAQTGPASADHETTSYPAEQLEIRVGYKDLPYTKVVRIFQPSDLEQEIGLKQHAYTFIDNLPCPVIDSAEGVELTDILDVCGINVDDVKSFKSFTFYTTDVLEFRPGTPYATLDKEFLLDTDRYYFPNITPDSWDQTEEGFYDPVTGYEAGSDIRFLDPEAAAAGKVKVPTMIALRDNWQRINDPAETYQPDYSNLDDSVRFRLVFGKTDDLASPHPEHTASRSAKWIYRIDVTLKNGTPVTGVSLDETSIDLKTGETKQLTAAIDPADATHQSVTWTSDGTKVATVSSDGLVSAVTAGKATITATTADGKFIAACVVNVSSSKSGSGGGGGSEDNTVKSVSLTSPALDQNYKPGDEVVISGTAQNLSAVSVDITDPNGKNVYSASNLGAAGDSFTTSFVLGDDAVSGSYTIKISGTGLTDPFTSTFTVGTTGTGSSPGTSTPGPDTPGTPSPGSPSEVPNFIDLNNHWAQQQIYDLVAAGMLKGMTPTEFMPDINTTRAQFVTMLVRIMGITPQPGAENTFKDVPVGAWYHDTVSAAVQAGLASGYSSDLFGPDDLITREQMACMMVRALVSRQEMTRPEPAEIEVIFSGYQDRDSISAWAKGDLALAVKLEIIRGRTSDTLNPQANATRAEAAVVIWRLADLMKQTGGN